MTDWPRLADQQWVQETNRRVEAQESHRSTLVSVETTDENALHSLDSTLKKTTAFMKKLKTLSAASIPSLIDELSRLNLSKFVEEMAAGIAETKLKPSDVIPIVDLCVAIASRYPKFSELILAEIRKGLPLKRADKISNPAKLRIDVRLLCELILCGVVGKEGLQTLGATLSYICITDKGEHSNVGLICSLCRPVGWQIAGIVPSPEASEGVSVGEGDLKVNEAITPEHRKVVNDLFSNYHTGLIRHLEKACAVMNVVQKKVKRHERTRGDATMEEKTELETARAEYERLKVLAVELSSALGVPMVDLKEEPSDNEEDEMAAMEMDKALAEGQVSLWPDDESRLFYENVIDIRNIVPRSLYKESEERTIQENELKTSVDDIDVDGLEVEPAEREGDADLGEKEESADEPYRPKTPPSPAQFQEDTTGAGEASLITSEEMKQLAQKFFLNLDHLVNRDTTDQCALDFVSNLNTKSYRKKLVKVLYGVPSSRLDLLPFYARLVASLSPVMPDLTTELSTMLIKQFREFVQRSGQERVEEKIKCVMFIGELVKFGVIPRAEALSCLRQLVYDFRGHSVDMVCAMIETAGFYLYRNSDSHPKMKIILDVVQKKKERIKDVRHVMLIDNAFFACIPPADSAAARRAQAEPPLMIFIRHLIVDINEHNVNTNIKCIRRLAWDDETIAGWCLKYLTSPWLLPYSNLLHLASAVAGLQGLTYYDWISTYVIDACQEMIRISLEVPGLFNQRAIASACYLGELYNYSVCDTPVIYKVLYQIISFPETDPLSWQEFYRVRMVCELLNTVADFFQTGRARRKMDYFLTYFHRFYWMKREQWKVNVAMVEVPGAEESGDGAVIEPPRFPADVEAEYRECMRHMRKSASLPKDLAEAEKAVEQVEQQLKEKLALASGSADEEEEEEDERKAPDRTLHQIAEEDGEEYGSDSERPPAIIAEDDADEKVCVHVEKPAIQPEDEEFMRQLDRMLADQIKVVPQQTSVAAAANPSVDMTVPAAVRNRFQRQICFEDSPGGSKNENSKPSMKVSLMARGKGNKLVLKTVSIEESALHEAWKKEREREEVERADIKRVTLGHTARIFAEEEQEMRQQIYSHSRFN
uniref:MIF4G domain-containing protein n=2 Tax=Haemonchus contortus TaxID=6289 RepID=A0A7I4YR71_HAECO